MKLIFNYEFRILNEGLINKYDSVLIQNVAFKIC
jgi:hypothetical protein